MWLATGCSLLRVSPLHQKTLTQSIVRRAPSSGSQEKHIRTLCDFYRSLPLPRWDAAYLRQSHNFVGSQKDPWWSLGRERGGESGRVSVAMREGGRERGGGGCRAVWVERKKMTCRERGLEFKQFTAIGTPHGNKWRPKWLNWSLHANLFDASFI